MRTPIRLVVAFAALALVAAACGDDSVGDTTAAAVDTTAATTVPPAAPSTTVPPVAPSTTVADDMDDDMSDDMVCGASSLHLDVAALSELGGDAHYEGWAIIDGVPATTGKFVVAGGTAVHLDGSPLECFTTDRLETATTIVITIEPAGDADDIPSDTHIVAGDIVDGTAVLTVDHPAALGTDFSEAAGTFVLATPTDGGDTNELSGIWFLELPGPVASLDLPALPIGWTYEGWAVIDGVPVTSGTFLAVDDFDAFDGYSGDQGGPAFPGEDYLVNAPAGVVFPTDLSGATVVVSVEPSPDDSTAPFAIKPLVGSADDPAADHVSYTLDNNAVDLPSATATIG